MSERNDIATLGMASNIMNGVIPKMATHGDKPEEESSQPKLKEQQQHYRLQRHLPNDPQTWRESSLGLTNGDGDDSGDGSKQWQGTPQGATNSLDTSYDLLFDGEYPVEYSCEDKIDIVNEPTSATTLSFYYEATLPKGQDPVANVEALEWSFLEGLARRTGLTDKCNFAKQYNNNVRDLQFASLEDSKEDESFDKYQNEASTRPEQRIRKLDDVSLSYPVTIYSINRNPSDTIKGKFKGRRFINGTGSKCLVGQNRISPSCFYSSTYLFLHSCRRMCSSRGTIQRRDHTMFVCTIRNESSLPWTV